MKKLTLALLAVAAGAAGAGAAYWLHPRHGAARREATRVRLNGWGHALSELAQQQRQAWGRRAASLYERLERRLHPQAELPSDDGLEPLEMTPPPLEATQSRRSRMLPALAMATPVAMAMGAAWLHHRREDGEWLH